MIEAAATLPTYQALPSLCECVHLDMWESVCLSTVFPKNFNAKLVAPLYTAGPLTTLCWGKMHLFTSNHIPRTDTHGPSPMT